jgi:hypothetical protein
MTDLRREGSAPVGQGSATDYLVVHEFLHGIYESLVIGEAFRRGLVDELLEGPIVAADQDWRLQFFVDVLKASDVVTERDGRYELTARFRSALRFRDLMEAHLYYSSMFMRDFVADTPRVFDIGYARDYVPEYLRLYNFERHDSEDPEDQVATEEWVAYMNALSKYEGPVACERYDFSRHRRMLDIGGNTGEFVLAVCDRNPDLRGTVFDLPGVVRIGQRVQVGRESFDRVEFVGGDAFSDDAPRGADLVSFKSTLHDWPADRAERLLEQGWAALEPGGTLLIFERSHVNLADHVPMPFTQLPILGWAWIFRGPGRYQQTLERLGAVDVQLEHFELDMTWMLLSATKPG